jgi:transposase
VTYHFRKWSRDGSLENLFKASILTVEGQLNLSELNLDGSHVIAKKGGESVAYQGRKRAKTTNILPITDKEGYVLATTKPVAGNHNDAFELKANLQTAFQFMKRLGLDFQGAYFNADSAFDTKAARKVCFNYGVVPNIAENTRNRQSVKRGRKRLFDADIYKHRFSSERTFAWIDKFRALIIRYDRKDMYFMGAHYIVYSMVNLRHILADEKFH